MPRELALIGGGHAHVEVIRRFGVSPIPDTRLTVFDPNPRPVYSGMVPGFIAGQYERNELEIDLEALCSIAGASFVEGAASKVRPGSIKLEDGTSFQFDIASLDIGSTVAGISRPGVRGFALPSRPIAGLIGEVDTLLASSAAGPPIHVVGAGAGGIEIAFCLDSRLRAAKSTEPRVVLVTSDPVVLQGSCLGVRTRVERALERRGIHVVPNSSVSSVHKGAIELTSGESLPSSHTVWVTGPASHPLAADSELPVDTKGFLKIGTTLQVYGHKNLFAVGDCASLPGMKKAGVYAVRAGPLLDNNLRAALGGGTLREYTPQHEFLSLLNLGDRTAIGSKWGGSAEGRWVMRLKNRIDRSFMETYR